VSGPILDLALQDGFGFLPLAGFVKRFTAMLTPLARPLWLPACLLLATTNASAQVTRPFVFTVTTTAADTGGDGRGWAAYYDAGYAERTDEPFGYDGFAQRIGFQGRLGSRYTLVGNVGIGIDADTTGVRSTQEAELLRDVLAPSSSLRLALGLGARHEWAGTTAALGRVSLGWSGRDALLFGNIRFEKPFAAGRDALDIISSVGWLQRLGHGWRAGVEAVGEDLEGFWVKDEAEGGAKLYAGPAVHWSSSTERLWVSASGGPVVYATRSGRSSPAPRPLDAAGNGLTLRLAVGCTF